MDCRESRAERDSRMNDEQFYDIAKSAYPDGLPYTFIECLGVFLYFFRAYKKHTGADHPPLKREQIKRIMIKMPFYDDCQYRIADIDPAEYPVLIDAYFRTPFRGCDYRINHFFSGRVRELRMYETLFSAPLDDFLEEEER